MQKQSNGVIELNEFLNIHHFKPIDENLFNKDLLNHPINILNLLFHAHGFNNAEIFLSKEQLLSLFKENINDVNTYLIYQFISSIYVLFPYHYKSRFDDILATLIDYNLPKEIKLTYRDYDYIYNTFLNIVEITRNKLIEYSSNGFDSDILPIETILELLSDLVNSTCFMNAYFRDALKEAKCYKKR